MKTTTWNPKAFWDLAGQDLGLAQELARLFALDVGEAIDRLERAVLLGDSEGASQVGHGLKSCCGQVGATEVVEQALELERLGLHLPPSARAHLVGSILALSQCLLQETRVGE